MKLLHNLILNTDSYKTSHFQQYPPRTTNTFFYLESRSGPLTEIVFFGLQAILMEYLCRPVTKGDVDEAAAILALHGVPFHRAGWEHIVHAHGGRLPIRIRAVPEGTVVPAGNVMMTVEATDRQCYWLPSYLETMLLRVWYPTTVATISHQARRVIWQHLVRSSDAPEREIAFKLHDFGARGVSSGESAAIGGMAHLVSFQGTDTLSAILAARDYYQCSMAGFSIPAAEHSTITSWGRDGEVDAYRNMLACYAAPGKVVAVVSDSYDVYRAITEHWGATLREAVQSSGATIVIRPDSGKPTEVVLRCLELLDQHFGSHRNAKGFRVLKNVRLIQGDGVNLAAIEEILQVVVSAGFSAENVAFGMGGGLLQQCNRDTFKFAIKCSAAQIDGQWRDVYKDPVTDPIKRSKRGRIMLARDTKTGRYTTLSEDAFARRNDRKSMKEILETVFEDGSILQPTTMEAIRQRAHDASDVSCP
jgi:nicotinamide phosphoribosyltransferase